MSVVGCSEDAGETHPAPATNPSAAAASAAAVDVPSPNLGTFLHQNYRVVSEQKAKLKSEEAVQDVVVVSSGAGLVPGTPVAGATEDVQVLTWDTIAHRWFQSFDAADKIVGTQWLSSTYLEATQPSPLLDQAVPISEVWVARVVLSRDEPLLAVYAQSLPANHEQGILSLVDVSKAGTEQVAYYDNEQGLERPHISGPAENQHIEVTGQYFSAYDAACCPLRSYTKQLAATQDSPPGQVTVAPTEDDRPLLGAYVITDPDNVMAAVVVSTAPGTPASALLQPADRILGVEGARAETGRSSNPVAPDQIGVHHPGERITLLVSRGGQLLHLSTTLASQDQDATLGSPPQGSMIGVNVVAAPAGQPPGVFIAGVVVDSPAESAGLGRGIEITAVGGTRVSNPTDLQVALADKAGVAVSLAIQTTDGDPGTVVVTPEMPSADSIDGLYTALL